MSKIPVISAIGDAVAIGLDNTRRAISKTIAATSDFMKRHWALAAALVLGLIAFTAVTIALTFFWPTTLATLATFSFTLPAIGTFAPLAFLQSLSIPAGAAVMGAFAFGATLAASAAINVFASAYNALDRFFNPLSKRRDIDRLLGKEGDYNSSAQAYRKMAIVEEETEGQEQDFKETTTQSETHHPAPIQFRHTTKTTETTTVNTDEASVPTTTYESERP